LWDVLVDIPRLKASRDPKRRVKFYRKGIVASWAATVVVWWVLGWRVMWLPAGMARWAWMTAPWARIAGWALVAVAAYAMFAPFFVLGRSKVRQAVQRRFSKLGFFLPGRRQEYHWFAVLCVTAGICEEVVFRGFLFTYFGVWPWHLGLAGAFFVSAAAFGIGHAYQGWKGILGTGVAGMLLGLLFVWTGSLWVPMAVHAVVDLRGLFLLKISNDREEAAKLTT
jgi:membrane protease YdiL (CAAX protease family)